MLQECQHVDEFLDTPEQAEAAGITISMWDPATQLRYAKKDKVPPRPDGAPNRWPDREPVASGLPHGL